MVTVYDATLWIYNLTLIPIIFFSISYILFSVMNLFLNEKRKRFPKLKELPFVSVQIPTFNDPIAERCVQKCTEFDYPRDRFEIMIVDDSTSIQTQLLLSRYEDKYRGLVKYIHRSSRQGFKPGALRNAMKQARGEVIVVFDADWIPKKDFLRKVVQPFSDPKVALVQTRQGFYNHKTNIITRFAAYLLMVYHAIMMPINNRLNCVFFCGTAGAIRRKPFEEVGGWNLDSITEDSDLIVRLLKKGYKTKYLNIETPSEVPDTFEAFIKQQMRWCYGNVRVFMDNAKDIMFGKGFSLRQRLMITYITLGNLAAPIVVLMTIFGFSGWFLGEPSLFSWQDMITLGSRVLLTAGFIIMGLIALFKLKRLGEFRHLILSLFTVGLVLAVANSIAFYRAVFNKGLHWHCTPKIANDETEIE